MPDTLHVHRDKDFLSDFLRRYWFAPPVALWRSVEAKTLSTLDFPAPMLDFGCGDGRFTEAIFGKQDGIYGCDIAKRELPAARDSGVYRHGVQFADGHYLPYRDGAFGTVYSNSVIEHIPDPQNVLPELARVLRPGGLLVLTVPSDRFRELLDGVRTAPTKEAAEQYARSVDQLFAHYHYHTADEWRVLLATVNVKLIEVRYYVSPETEQQWDRMNRTYGIGKRSLFNVLASPRLRPLGFQPAMARMVHDRLIAKLRPYYDARVTDRGGGLLVVGRKLN
ncbi:MAG: class I SAM-dependent methyltransferase [Anaerolineae bacterium]|nr:class I SAM-dependent methyltransferase [Candidatus Roseilinea sp.]MDW8451217.1 class I SAM-dependent methyltransferase [Anaerolineae bacterium]